MKLRILFHGLIFYRLSHKDTYFVQETLLNKHERKQMCLSRDLLPRKEQKRNKQTDLLSFAELD